MWPIQIRGPESNRSRPLAQKRPACLYRPLRRLLQNPPHAGPIRKGRTRRLHLALTVSMALQGRQECNLRRSHHHRSRLFKKNLHAPPHYEYPASPRLRPHQSRWPRQPQSPSPKLHNLPEQCQLPLCPRRLVEIQGSLMGQTPQKMVRLYKKGF